MKIAAGKLTALITVTVFADTAVEGDETFTVALGSPTGAAVTVVRPSGTGTILDDD